MRAAFEKLQSAAHKVAEAMYKQAGGGGGRAAGAAAAEAGAGGGAGPKDDVIDAEFEDKSS